MEQQKILWIMLAVAVLIMAVLGGAFFIFSPVGDPVTVSKTESDDPLSDRFDPVEWARSGEEYPGVTESEVDPSSDSTDFVIYGEAGSSNEVFSRDTDKVLQQEEAVTVAVAPVIPKPIKKVTPAPVAPKKSVTVVPKKSVTVAKPKSTPRSKPKPAPVTKIVNEYWIQTAAPASLVGAEQAKKVLSDKGFPSTIQTTTIDGKIFYRVRVGAYLTKKEAEKFLEWIKEMKGFEESYISVVKAKRQIL